MKKVRFIIKANEYIFLLKELNHNVKVNKKILELNYKKSLIYKNIIYFKSDKNIFIYNSNRKIFLPEGWILFNSIKDDGIYIFKQKDYYNIIVVKNRVLLRDFFVKELDNIKLLEFEFNLPSYKKEYNKYFKIGLKNLNYFTLIKAFIEFDLDKNKIKSIFKEFSNIFLIVTLLVFAILYGYKYYLEKSYQTKLTQFNSIKSKTSLLQKKISKIESIYKKYNLISSLKLNKPLKTAEDIASIIPNGYKFSYFNNYNEKVIFIIDGNDSLIILNRLNNLKSLQNIKLTSSTKISPSLNRFRFEGEIK